MINFITILATTFYNLLIKPCWIRNPSDCDRRTSSAANESFIQLTETKDALKATNTLDASRYTEVNPGESNSKKWRFPFSLFSCLFSSAQTSNEVQFVDQTESVPTKPTGIPVEQTNLGDQITEGPYRNRANAVVDRNQNTRPILMESLPEKFRCYILHNCFLGSVDDLLMHYEFNNVPAEDKKIIRFLAFEACRIYCPKVAASIESFKDLKRRVALFTSLMEKFDQKTLLTAIGYDEHKKTVLLKFHKIKIETIVNNAVKENNNQPLLTANMPSGGDGLHLSTIETGLTPNQEAYMGAWRRLPQGKQPNIPVDWNEQEKYELNHAS